MQFRCLCLKYVPDSKRTNHEQIQPPLTDTESNIEISCFKKNRYSEKLKRHENKLELIFPSFSASPAERPWFERQSV